MLYLRGFAAFALTPVQHELIPMPYNTYTTYNPVVHVVYTLQGIGSCYIVGILA